MKIITRDQIDQVLPALDLLPAIEEGFAAYSNGRAVVPPVGELLLEKGEVHIKYGCIKNDPYYVIKIASGFYDNPKLDLPSSNGMMLLFKQATGEPVSVLLDEGLLTDTRTAAAGAIAAKYLAPRKVHRIGMVGTGIQARLQLKFLKPITSARQVLVWGHNQEHLNNYKREMETEGFQIDSTPDAGEIHHTCNLIITTTPSRQPLLYANDLQTGTHITAVGSDTPQKQELDSVILKKADLIVVDSISQCLERGETHHALRAGQITKDDIVELGNLIQGKTKGRISESQVTVADLTGVAVQDLKIAEAVYKAVR